MTNLTTSASHAAHAQSPQTRIQRPAQRRQVQPRAQARAVGAALSTTICRVCVVLQTVSAWCVEDIHTHTQRTKHASAWAGGDNTPYIPSKSCNVDMVCQVPQEGYLGGTPSRCVQCTRVSVSIIVSVSIMATYPKLHMTLTAILTRFL